MVYSGKLHVLLTMIIMEDLISIIIWLMQAALAIWFFLEMTFI